MSQDTCTLPDLCAKVACLQSDMDTMWGDFYGADERVYIATGNIGIPAAQDYTSAFAVYQDDQIEYMRGTGVINGENPDGLFLVGGSNFDYTNRLAAVPYPLINQELKVAGFSALIAAKKVFPVMGDYDYFIAFDKVSGTVPERMADTYLRLFSYLPDAKRYYSVYDDKTNTEFFVLSSGRYTNYNPTVPTTGYIFPNDILVGGEQWNWLVQRCNSTPARNRVVVFTDPFVSVPDNFRGVQNQGANNVFPDFATWDFASLGIKLIINGRAGNSFHLKKSSINIVNASAFSRSRFGITEVATNVDPPAAPPLYGQAGYIVEYLSHQPMEDMIRNVNMPNPPPINIVPKNEFFRMRCRKDGITCEFVSYDPYAASQQLTNDSQVIEHTFEISAI